MKNYYFKKLFSIVCSICILCAAPLSTYASETSMVISQISYEIHFTYDDGYYTHCYHQTCKSYNSSGSLIDTTKYYMQSVGG